MWQCSECKREFTKKNQDHFCGEPPKTVDAYIASQPEEVRPLLRNLREKLKETLPGATEKIAWRMPTYRRKRNIIHFAAFKRHIGIYPGEEAMRFFAHRLAGYKTSKGAIQVPYTESFPMDLVVEIATWCAKKEENHG